jgi:outer membrane protein
MRYPVRAALAALALSLPAAAVARPAAAQAPAAAQRFAYVDVAQVMEQVPGRAEAQQTFEREANGIRAEVQRMSDSMQTLVTGYQRQQATLTPAQRQTRERELQTRQQQYAQRAQALQERGQRREQEIANQFESVVRQAIEEVRSSGGYAMVFASGANSAMLAADRSLDVTAQVTARMRTIAAARPAGGAAAPAAPSGGAAGAAPGGATGGAPAAAPAGAARPRPPQR